MIQKGRPLTRAWAHCRGENANSIGICLVGLQEWRLDLQFDNLTFLIRELESRFGELPVYPHRHFSSAKAQGKTCPNDQYWPDEYKDILDFA